VNPSERPHIFPLQNVSQNYFHKIGKFKKISPRENQNIWGKDELMENICHSLDALLPWQQSMPKKQNLKNKGNYVGNPTGKIQEQRLQDNRTKASFASLASSYTHFCRNCREPP